MKLKSIFFLMGVILCASIFFVACSDDDDNVSDYNPGRYQYDVILMNEDYIMEMELDSVTSDITEIKDLPDWIRIRQSETDEEGHPVIKIKVQAEERGKAREADVMLKTKGGDRVKLSFIQSMVYSTLGFHTGEQSDFNPENWFEVDEIDIYDRHINALRTVGLPWADPAPTAMPDDYRNVNKSHDLWQLCFNTCSNPNLPDTQMFGLFNKCNHTMRVFVYFIETPTDATTCYFVVSVPKNSAILAGDNLNWAIPLDVATSNWVSPTQNLIQNMPVNLSSVVIPPVCGNIRGSLSPGWVAFDIKLSSSFENIEDILTKTSSHVQFSLLSCDITNTTGTQDFSNITMKSDEIKIMSPGSSTKRAALGCAAAGNFLQGITTSVANGVTIGQASGPAGIVLGIVQGLGVCCNLASDCINADDAGKDQVAYTMTMDFHFGGKTEINTQSITYKGNNFTPITMSIGEMFKYLLYNKAPKRQSPQKGNSADEKINFGIWNLAQSPTIYVSKDVLFYNESQYGTDYNSDGNTIESFGKDEKLRYASFLDPSSIQVYINEDLTMFPHDKVKNLEVTAYDFIYEDNSFDRPDMFYDLYKIKNDKMCLTTEDNSWNYIFNGDSKSMQLVECDDKNLLLDPSNGKLTYKTMQYLADDLENIGYTFKYGGVYSDFPDELASYNAIYDPIIYVPRSENGLYPVKPNFANLGVAVVISFDIDDMHYSFARRFLPEIKTFSKSDISNIRNRINNYNQKTKDGLNADFKLFDKEKAKALRILDLVK